jgi:hypothetical protein
MYNTALTADYADFADYADEQAAKSIAIRLPRVSSTGTVKRTGAARRHEKMKSPTSPPASTLPVGKGLYYTFEPRDSNWSGLDILIGTHARPASGELVLRIHTSTSTGAAERALRSVRFDLQKARDNDWVELRFPPIRNAQGHKFILEFTLANPGPQTLISLYQSAPLPGKAERIYRRIARELGAILQGEQLYCREWYQ